MNYITIHKASGERRYWSLVFSDVEIDRGEYIVYQDEFGRTWKLEPITNENIMMPFKITPLPQVGDK